MKLGAVAVNTSIPLTHIVKASYSKGKITVPVNSAAAVLGGFKHITGIPTFAKTGGLSVNRLKQLDIMIDHITRLRKGSFSVNLEGFDSSAFDKITEKYSEMLRDQVVSRSSDYNTGAYSPGALFNITA